MHGLKRALVIVGATLGCASAGFSLGALVQAASMVPGLAGGGHAVGGEHTNFMVIGALAGAAFGLLVGWWVSRAMGRRGD